jgi:hypothetical protein
MILGKGHTRELYIEETDGKTAESACYKKNI